MFQTIEICNLNDGRRIIKYRDQYVNHEIKFGIAFDYLQQRDYINCIVLNDEGSFSPKSFLWRDFTIGLLPNTEARLSIFYVDFKYTNENLNDIEITSIPQIDLDVLRKGISELETALGDLPI